MGIPEAVKKIGVKNNVIMRVIDEPTGRIVSETVGHNSATHSMLIGVGHYLKGDGVFNQGYDMLSRYLPRYISLGTMGLINQDEDEYGLPAGIGVTDDQGEEESDEDFEIRRFKDYINTVPGYGADGYSATSNNGRAYFGLGQPYSNEAVDCELISTSFPRAKISYRVILPESQSELPETIDVVFSAYISTGALAKFRGDKDYIFITETGLWSYPNYSSSGAGLIAGYRITPTSDDDYDMEIAENRQKLKHEILRVGKNQIVQVIWKIQIGIAGSFAYDSTTYRELMKIIEEGSTSDRGVFGTNSALMINDFNRSEVGTVSNMASVTTASLTSMSAVADWLSTNAVPDYFDSVTVSGSNTFTCSKDGHTALTINRDTIYVYVASGVYKAITTYDALTPVSSIPTRAIKGAGGILLAMYGYGGTPGYTGDGEIIITKDNNGETTVIAATRNSNSNTRQQILTGSMGSYDRGIIAVAWGDNKLWSNTEGSRGLRTTFSAMSSSSTGTELVAFLKTPGADVESISYTPNAYYIKYAPSSLYSYGSSYGSAFAEFTLNGKTYYTNGYWAVRKEL